MECVAQFGLEQVAGFNWNGWLVWTGMTGFIAME